MSRRRTNVTSCRIATPGKLCCFCGLSENNELEFGKIYELGNIVTHYYCLLLSSMMQQKGRDDQGILGFLSADIEKEVKRGKRLVCYHCKKNGATLGCCNTKCKRIFHLPCGLKAGSLHQFYSEFRSYCINHRPKQLIDGRVLEEVQNSENTLCYICYDNVNYRDILAMLWAPCCKKNAFFHRKCVQQLANSSGYFFKCPLCNNKKEFQEAMLEHGIFIPSQDASWELVPNAFHELLYRHNQCDAETCVCPKGRTHSSSTAKWELVLCRMCGSQGIHRHCGHLKWSSSSWECGDCRTILEKSSLVNRQIQSGGCEGNNEIGDANSKEIDSDSDLSVGQDSSEQNYRNDVAHAGNIPIVKVRPGPLSYKMKEVMKVAQSQPKTKGSSSSLEGTNSSSSLPKSENALKNVKDPKTVILLDSDEEPEDIEIISEKLNPKVLTTNDGKKIEILNKRAIDELSKSAEDPAKSTNSNLPNKDSKPTITSIQTVNPSQNANLKAFNLQSFHLRSALENNSNKNPPTASQNVPELNSNFPATPSPRLANLQISGPQRAPNAQNLPSRSITCPNFAAGSVTLQNFAPRSDAGQNYQPRSDAGQNFQPRSNAGQNFRPRSVTGQNVGTRSVTPQNFATRNVNPQNFGPRGVTGQNTGIRSVTPQNFGPRSVTGQNFGPRSITGQNFGPRATAGQNFAPRSVTGQNFAPRAATGQNFAPRSVTGQNFAPRAATGQNFSPRAASGQNFPPRGATPQIFHLRSIGPQSLSQVTTAQVSSTINCPPKSTMSSPPRLSPLKNFPNSVPNQVNFAKRTNPDEVTTFETSPGNERNFDNQTTPRKQTPIITQASPGRQRNSTTPGKKINFENQQMTPGKQRNQRTPRKENNYFYGNQNFDTNTENENNQYFPKIATNEDSDNLGIKIMAVCSVAPDFFEKLESDNQSSIILESSADLSLKRKAETAVTSDLKRSRISEEGLMSSGIDQQTSELTITETLVRRSLVDGANCSQNDGINVDVEPSTSSVLKRNNKFVAPSSNVSFLMERGESQDVLKVAGNNGACQRVADTSAAFTPKHGLSAINVINEIGSDAEDQIATKAESQQIGNDSLEDSKFSDLCCSNSESGNEFSEISSSCDSAGLIPDNVSLSDVKFRVCGSDIVQVILYDKYRIDIKMDNSGSRSPRDSDSSPLPCPSLTDDFEDMEEPDDEIPRKRIRDFEFEENTLQEFPATSKTFNSPFHGLINREKSTKVAKENLDPDQLIVDEKITNSFTSDVRILHHRNNSDNTRTSTGVDTCLNCKVSIDLKKIWELVESQPHLFSKFDESLCKYKTHELKITEVCKLKNKWLLMRSKSQDGFYGVSTRSRLLYKSKSMEDLSAVTETGLKNKEEMKNRMVPKTNARRGLKRKCRYSTPIR